MDIQQQWRWWLAYLNGTPGMETSGIQFNGKPAHVLQRPGVSADLADELWRQSREGVFDLNALKEIAPQHRHDHWLLQGAEASNLGEVRLDGLRRLAATGSRRAVLTFPQDCGWTALHLHRQTLLLYQRSLNMWLGAPYDWDLLRRLARYLEARRIVWTVGSAHIYERDVDAVRAFLGDMRED